jgi:hypothetical protein
MQHRCSPRATVAVSNLHGREQEVRLVRNLTDVRLNSGIGIEQYNFLLADRTAA